MINNDSERKFISHGVAAYEGMSLEEVAFCKMEDYHGVMQDYKLDVIKAPDESDAPLPVVIFVHGGGFVQPHNKRQGYIPVFAKALTKAGYAVVSPDYPIFDNRAHRDTWNETIGADRAAEAVHYAYLFVKENAKKYNFDPERIAVMGGSAGGMTCFYLLEYYDDSFRFFGNCWGTPWHRVPDVKKFPPTVSIHGTADQTVSFDLEAPVQEALEKAGIPHELVAIEGAPHTPMKHFAEFIPTVLTWLDRYMK
jgi:acetyl esterase/lipase